MKRPIFSSTERDAMVGVLRGAGVAALAAAAVLLGVALLTYDPADPGAYTATWRAATNLLGAPGAFVADFMMRAIGYASFGVVAFGLVWALRFALRRFSPAVALDLLAAPLAIALLAGFASSHDAAAPFGGGYGGLIGDTIFGVFAHAVPVADDQVRFVAATLLLAALTAFVAMIALGGRLRDLVALIVESARRWRLLGLWLLDAAAAWATERRLGANPALAAAGPAGGLDAPITLNGDMLRRRERDRGPVDRHEPDFSAPFAEPPRESMREALRAASREAARGPQNDPYGDAADDRVREPAFAQAPPRDETRGERHVDRTIERPASWPFVVSEPPAGEDGAGARAARAAQPGRALDTSAVEAIARARASARSERPEEARAAETVDAAPEPRVDARDDRAAGHGAATPNIDLAPTSFAPASFGAAWRPEIDLSVSIAPPALGVQEITLEAPIAAEPAEAQPAKAEPTQTPTLEHVLAPPSDRDDATDATELDDGTGYRKPQLDLLADGDADNAILMTEQSLAEQADRLQAVLHDYGVRGEIIDVNPGPVVSQFELEPAPGLKASRVIGLAEDVARSMSAVAARISTIPGRNVIGIELPNEERETVLLRRLLEDQSFAESDARLPLALGRDIAGAPVVADLAAMPHLLIAGTTGSGKSVAINTMILSLLFQKTPEEVRLILIDPKMLELSVYNDTPHLLSPVVTDPKQAVRALRWVVREMERRYQRMAQLNVRSIDSYNQKVAEAAESGQNFERTTQIGFDETTGEPIYDMTSMPLERLPLIVVVIDEMADLMLVAGKEIEHCIQRLAQMARASGIHLVMATQRPSVDVITGVIKANFPIRISFQVTSKIDSRTILGENGAEQLLGKGDMLFTAGGGRLQRIHGPFASDQDVETVVAYLRRFGASDDMVSFDEDESGPAGASPEGEDAEPDESGDEALYERAVKLVTTERRASTSFLQRRLQLGYNRAARIVEMMEQRGIVSAANHVGKREVLAAATA